MMCLLAVVASVLTIFFSCGQALAQDQTDASSLIGEWQGEWSNTAGLRGKVVLTIKAVRGSQFTDAVVYIVGPAPFHNRDLPSSGGIMQKDGKTIAVVSNEHIGMELTLVEPTKMQGEGRGPRASAQIWLSKCPCK